MEAALVDGELLPGDVCVVDGTIEAVGLASTGRGIAAPGFVDLQVNGFAGVDLMATDRDGYLRVGEALLATGTTAFQPTFVTASEAALLDALRAMPTSGHRPAGPRRPRRRARSCHRAGRACTTPASSRCPTWRCCAACSTPRPCPRSRSRPSCPARSS